MSSHWESKPRPGHFVGVVVHGSPWPLIRTSFWVEAAEQKITA